MTRIRDLDDQGLLSKVNALSLKHGDRWGAAIAEFLREADAELVQELATGPVPTVPPEYAGCREAWLAGVQVERARHRARELMARQAHFLGGEEPSTEVLTDDELVRLPSGVGDGTPAYPFTLVPTVLEGGDQFRRGRILLARRNIERVVVLAERARVGGMTQPDTEDRRQNILDMVRECAIMVGDDAE